MKDLTSHIFRKHNIKAARYKELYPNMPIRSDALLKLQSERIKGNKNPAHNHGGKFSPFSEKYIHGTKNVEAIKQKAKENKQKLNKDTTKLSYWLEKTNGNVEEAEKLLAQRQATFSLDKCIAKYGNEKGHEIWLNRQEKWQKNYRKSNFSKVSQELFWQIFEKLDSSKHIFFAELGENKEKDLSGINHELVLRLNESVIKPDFVDVEKRKIIEFDGEYWHKVKNKDYSFEDTRDAKKEKTIIDGGYSLLRIGEKEYKNDKNGTIEKCLIFLKQ